MAGRDPNSIAEWLATPLGRSLLAAERRQVASVLEHVFGVQLIQIGVWGPTDAFLPLSRTQRAAAVSDRSEPGVAAWVDPNHLGLATDCADAVLLPHTLDFTPSPHGLLREVDRVLRPDGRLIILSFNPGGAWGVRHLVTPGGYPPGARRMIGKSRLSDWLELLSFDVESPKHYCHLLPVSRFSEHSAAAASWLPFLAGGYLISARKRVHPLTPIRPGWRQRRLKVVGGLVEPSTRSHSTRQAR